MKKKDDGGKVFAFMKCLKAEKRKREDKET